MATTTVTVASRSARKRRPASAGSLTPASGLGLGVAMIWFSLLVLIPLSAIVVKAAGGGWSTFEHVLASEQTRSALQLTVLSSLAVTAVNMVMGTMIAWMVVRDRFRGMGLLDLLIDIPFAMPTIVVG